MLSVLKLYQKNKIENIIVKVENMKVKKNGRFKDDIRKTFIIYALIPVAIITFVSFALSFSILYRTVINQNKSINKHVSIKINSIVSTYMEETIKLSTKKNIIAAIKNKSADVEIYEDLYGFVNSMDIKCNFFVFDNKMKPIVESNMNKPEYAKAGNVFLFGITERMFKTPNKVILERISSVESLKQTLTIGKAIMDHDKIIGYITFDLDNRDISTILSQNYSTTVVISDSNDYIISGSNAAIENKFGKVDETIRNHSGFTKLVNDSNYITKTVILNNSINVYTITSIGYIGSILIIVGVLLILLFIMLTITTFLSAKKIANSKTKVIDEITEAMGQVEQGNLDRVLNINSQDEFQIIAQSYNKMLIDIKNLIEMNKESARENVLSEIQQLESQFNPHFLFNTLEMIKYMCKIEPESVNKIIVGLSKVLRYSINNSISQVTVAEDIEYTKNYLLIQKYRFGKRFDYTIEVDQDTCNCIVPKLIVQPIIENAIKYGYENKKYLSVNIHAAFEEDKLVIVISDNGVGMEASHLKEIREILMDHKNNSNHIGLFNVNRRIQLMYGKDYGLEIQSKKNKGTVVKILLPICRGEKDYVEGTDC
jgi:two-component system, sensor histidine kinase YesM